MGKLREEIAIEFGQFGYNKPWDDLTPLEKQAAYRKSDYNLSLVCKRIEGVANPDIPMLRASQNIRETIVRLYDYYKAGSLPSEIYQDLVKSSGINLASFKLILKFTHTKRHLEYSAKLL